jgi:membrane-bound lytic murein transglycosylase D
MNVRSKLKTLVIIAALGSAFNTMPSAANAASNAAPLTACTRFYTLRRGDTLTRVAKRFNTSIGRIMALNNLADEKSVAKGRMLCVRAKADVVGPVTVTLTVQDGETLAILARRYGTSVTTLRKLNRIRTVKAGQVIIVPMRRVKARGV